ncbi:MAG: NTP transferase domain-containing protein [Oscillospiraceae bacterium]|nr:NTP transferase domain-containing protein [Oscillospiraceae bacterium]
MGIPLRRKSVCWISGSTDMTRKEFNLLAYLERSSGQKHTQRSIGAAIGVSAGTVNKILAAFHEQSWITPTLEVTEAGLQALEPYRVKRVIFLAAGFGSRLVPLTLNTPKPLIRVHGTRIIDTAIDRALEAGIEEIYIVRGYLGEQFDQLLAKYPQIRFLENPDYQESNNISSALCARHLLENAYVMEADLLVNSAAVFQKYHYTSNCLGVPVERTDDWCILSENGVARQLVQGGENCHHLFCVYYWTAEEGQKLAGHLEKVYRSPGGKERFWDMAPLVYFNKEYHIEIRECSFSDITEIDTLRELQAVDPAYKMLH